MKKAVFHLILLLVCATSVAQTPQHPAKEDVLKIIHLTNRHWQSGHPNHENYFWNRAVYHVGNMEAYRTTGEQQYLDFSRAWAERNKWSGPANSYDRYRDPQTGQLTVSNEPNNWLYGYGENNVLFGDCQICFQVYSEILDATPDADRDLMLGRALEVMGHEISTANNDYLWWADGLFMVMPVMTHMFHQTDDVAYLNKMYDYWRYAVSLMWDDEAHLFYRDAKYVYPQHTTVAGGKDFWARGDGWVFAALARVLADFDRYVLPKSNYDEATKNAVMAQRDEYIAYYRMMAESLKAAQQPEGFWSRSILDLNQAPGYESTGTELMLYGYLWGINNGIFDEKDYGTTVDKAWRYLTEVALQWDGSVGYMQPIGENASPNTTVSADSHADFGMGGFLLAASEMYRYATDDGYRHTFKEYSFPLNTKLKYTIQQQASGLYLNIENDQNMVLLSERPSAIGFVPTDNPAYFYLTNGTQYVGMAGTNAWTMSALPEKATTWTVNALPDGTYTIKGGNGCIGTDDMKEGAQCYADKSSSATRSKWLFEAVAAEDEDAETTLEQPVDYTAKIVNQSFESGLDGWTNDGMQTQGNNEAKAGKDGRLYCEKWTKAPQHLADCSVSQKVNGLPDGQYRIVATCHAENQSGTPSATSGAYLFAGSNTTAVTSTADYEVTGTAANGHLTIGFKTVGTDANWATVDNFRLYLIGESTSAYRSYLADAIKELENVLASHRWISDELRHEAAAAIAEAREANGREGVLEAIRNIEDICETCSTYRIPVDRSDEDFDSYLFVYFPSNENENLYYALSTDGFNYTPLNDGARIMSSDTVALKKGIRDPHILRGADGKTFYMVATDMRCAEGWSSNRGIVMYRSTDLIHWQHSTVHFPTRFPEWETVTRVWAPETIWDADHVNEDGTRGAYMIYYSLRTSDGKCPYDKVYYSYANADFTDISQPVYLYDRGSATIDANIVYDETDLLYHMIYKNEGSGGICQVTAASLTAPEGAALGSQWSRPSGTLQQTSVAVEGGGLFRLIGTNTWVMMYDCYTGGYYQFCVTDDWATFTLKAQTATSGAFTPRHGTVIALRPAETQALLAAFPTRGLHIDPPVGIDSTMSVSAAASAEYYTVSGVRLDAPQRGVTIVRTTNADGRIITSKIMK